MPIGLFPATAHARCILSFRQKTKKKEEKGAGTTPEQRYDREFYKGILR